jgi:hypothetical protein
MFKEKIGEGITKKKNCWAFYCVNDGKEVKLHPI